MAEALVWLEETALPSWVREGPQSVWVYPAVLTLHTFGLMVLVGLSAAVNLRLLGAGARIPVTAMGALFPLMWAGFWINACSGALLFAADASAKASSIAFLMKIALVALGAVTLIAIRRGIGRAAAAPDDDTGLTMRGLAVASLLIWTAAVTAGRLLAYV